MADLTTTIDGYRVELDVLTTSSCWISMGCYSSSLEVLLGYGHITNHNDTAAWDVPQSTIDKIEAWAMANGY